MAAERAFTRLSGTAMTNKPSLSLRIGIVHLVIVGVCAACLISPMANRPGPMAAVLIVPLAYCLLSFIPAMIGAVVGLVEVVGRQSKTLSAVGLCVNVGYLIAYAVVVALMWETWMSV